MFLLVYIYTMNQSRACAACVCMHARHMVTSMEDAVTTGSVIHGVDSLLWGGFRVGVCDRYMI